MNFKVDFARTDRLFLTKWESPASFFFLTWDLWKHVQKPMAAMDEIAEYILEPVKNSKPFEKEKWSFLKAVIALQPVTLFTRRKRSKSIRNRIFWFNIDSPAADWIFPNLEA